MKSLAPIILFTFNRLDHTKQTVEALLKNDLAKESILYVFSDGASREQDVQKVAEVRSYLEVIKGFGSVHLEFSKENKGLATSIIEGVSKVFETHDKVIVLEDDLQTSPYFLQFMNEALDFYSPDDIWSVAGYTPNISLPNGYPYSTFLIHRNCSWGWGTWKQNWLKTDWEVKDFNLFFIKKSERRKFNRGGNDLSVMLLKLQLEVIHSWSIRFNYAAYKENSPTVYPATSLVRNLGVDGSGTNMKSSKKYQTIAGEQYLEKDQFCPVNNYNTEIENNFRKFYNTSLYRKFINYLKINKYVSSLKSDVN